MPTDRLARTSAPAMEASRCASAGLPCADAGTGQSAAMVNAAARAYVECDIETIGRERGGRRQLDVNYAKVLHLVKYIARQRRASPTLADQLRGAVIKWECRRH